MRERILRPIARPGEVGLCAFRERQEAVRAALAEADGAACTSGAGLSRRAALAAGRGRAGGGADALDGGGRARPRAGPRTRPRAAAREGRGPHAHVPRGLRALPRLARGRTRARPQRTIAANGFYGQQWTFWEHTGHAHGRARATSSPAAGTSDEITLEELIRADRRGRHLRARGARARPRRSPRTTCAASSAATAAIPKGALVAMNSGWAAKAGDADAFMGNDMQFPGFSGAAPTHVAARGARRIGGIGVDTLSLDNGPSQTFAEPPRRCCGADRVRDREPRQPRQAAAARRDRRRWA